MATRIPTGSLGGAGITWVTPDLPTLFGGGTAVDGTNVTVNTAWTLDGNNAQCNITNGIAADGMKEGYVLPVAIGPLCALLGIEEADLLSGDKECGCGTDGRHSACYHGRRRRWVPGLHQRSRPGGA